MITTNNIVFALLLFTGLCLSFYFNERSRNHRVIAVIYGLILVLFSSISLSKIGTLIGFEGTSSFILNTPLSTLTILVVLIMYILYDVIMSNRGKGINYVFLLTLCFSSFFLNYYLLSFLCFEILTWNYILTWKTNRRGCLYFHSIHIAMGSTFFLLLFSEFIQKVSEGQAYDLSEPLKILNFEGIAFSLFVIFLFLRLFSFFYEFKESRDKIVYLLPWSLMLAIIIAPLKNYISRFGMEYSDQITFYSILIFVPISLKYWKDGAGFVDMLCFSFLLLIGTYSVGIITYKFLLILIIIGTILYYFINQYLEGRNFRIANIFYSIMALFAVFFIGVGYIEDFDKNIIWMKRSLFIFCTFSFYKMINYIDRIREG